MYQQMGLCHVYAMHLPTVKNDNKLSTPEEPLLTPLVTSGAHRMGTSTVHMAPQPKLHYVLEVFFPFEAIPTLPLIIIKRPVRSMVHIQTMGNENMLESLYKDVFKANDGADYPILGLTCEGRKRVPSQYSKTKILGLLTYHRHGIDAYQSIEFTPPPFQFRFFFFFEETFGGTLACKESANLMILF